MILYHGSDKLFKEPDLEKCRIGKDFGKGFYLTKSPAQAKQWATRRKSKKGYVYTYEVRESLLSDVDNYQIKILTQYNKEWLDYVTYCRYKYIEDGCDLVYDRMADNTSQEITAALEQYYLGTMTVFETLAIIKDKHPYYCQYCFKSEKILKELIKRGEPQEVFR